MILDPDTEMELDLSEETSYFRMYLSTGGQHHIQFTVPREWMDPVMEFLRRPRSKAVTAFLEGGQLFLHDTAKRAVRDFQTDPSKVSFDIPVILVPDFSTCPFPPKP